MPDDLSVDDVALVTVAEAAARLGVEPATIRQWKRRYQVRSTTERGMLLLSLSDLWDIERDTRTKGRGRARQRST